MSLNQETNAMTQESPQGPVVIIGGGIAGMQAAIDLSAAGFGSCLVEQSSTLGGMIPNLHRTFPLCSCCKTDLRIAACEQDPNIQVMLNTKVQDISGKAGNFSVVLVTPETKKSFQAGAIIMAAGMEVFKPTALDIYGYGQLPNVVTSLEFEQMQKPLVANQGKVTRPSDGAVPKKIAWLQCIGSRDTNRCDASYCSSVCCMYALKEATNCIQTDASTDAAIFFMDMRAHGKGYERYFDQAVNNGVRFVRSRVHSVMLDADDNLLIRYINDAGQAETELFNLVVLSVGLRPAEEGLQLARKIGLALNENNYLASGSFSSVSTSIPGIYACGGINGPLDMAQSLMQASASVAAVISSLNPEPFAPPKTYPELSDISSEPTKIFVAYHLCPGMDETTGSIISDYAKTLPAVTAVADVKGDALGAIVNGLKESYANRLVFVSCTPLVHKGLVEEALRLSGLHPSLYEMVDLRAVGTTSASKQIQARLKMGVSRVSFISPAPLKRIPVEKRALVVGGGIAGLEGALAIAKAGFPVTLVEKSNKLGGNANHLKHTWGGDDVQDYLKALVSKIEADSMIDVLLEATVKSSQGSAGNFLTTIIQGNNRLDAAHGVTLLAAGAKASATSEYAYGASRNVYTWEEISKKLISDPDAILKAKNAVFIQCVGSREPEHPYCSNVCCAFSVRTAIDLKLKNPDMNIYILYREMRTFGEKEALYREALGIGIIFIRYNLKSKPVIKTQQSTNNLNVVVHDQILGRKISINADLVSLQTAITPGANQELAQLFSVQLDPDGFIAESPQKTRPMESSKPGIYFAGIGHYPKDMGESITQARGAAARLMEILKQDTIEVGELAAEVNPEKCAVCCTCVRTCPFHVPRIDHDLGAAYIDPALCMGCGMCVAECPGKAIVMASCSDEMLNQAPSFLMVG
jgi:heterodisulfide reductase subunit A